MIRGVYEEEIAPAGQRWFKVATSDGQVGIVHLPASMTDGLIKELWDRLDRFDPEMTLRLVAKGSRQ